MHVDLKSMVMPCSAVAHPPRHIYVVLKLFNTTLNDTIVVACKNTKLARMKTKPHIKFAGHPPHFCKTFCGMCLYIRLTVKPAPIRLSVHRKNIATNTYHTKFMGVFSYTFNKFKGCFKIVFNNIP